MRYIITEKIARTFPTLSFDRTSRLKLSRLSRTSVPAALLDAILVTHAVRQKQVASDKIESGEQL